MKKERKIFLAIKTDSETARINLNEDKKSFSELSFQSKGELSKIIIPKIETLLKKNKLKYGNLAGVVAYTGPGSFTGLRIGLSVANTIAFANKIPIFGVSKTDSDEWWKKMRKSAFPLLPFYGGVANITKPKK